MRYISIFGSAREVIKCDKKCKENGVVVKIVPVPEKYSSSCGMSIEIDDLEMSKFKEVVQSLEMEVSIYEL